MRTFVFCVVSLTAAVLLPAAASDRAGAMPTGGTPTASDQLLAPLGGFHTLHADANLTRKTESETMPEIDDSSASVKIELPEDAALVGDSLIRDALLAFKSNDEKALVPLVQKSLESGHPLAAYPQLWLMTLDAQKALADSLKNQAEKTIPDPMPLELAGRFARLIIAHEGSYIAEAAKTQWARFAAQAMDASTFEMLYGQLSWNRNEEDLLCAHAEFSLDGKNKTKSLAAAKQVLKNARYPEGQQCKRLSQAVLQRDPGWSWTYALLMMQKKRFTLTRELLNAADAKVFPVPKDALVDVLNDPRQWFERTKDNLGKQPARLLVFAALRLIPVDIKLAAQTAQAAQGRITPGAQAMLWGHIGYTASVDLLPEALTYYKNAGSQFSNLHKNALAYNGEQLQLWRARASLRWGTSSDRLAAIDALSDKLKASAAWRYWKARTLQDTGKLVEAERLLLPLTKSFDFYGLLACDALNLPYYRGDVRLTPPADPKSFEVFDADPGLIRARAFYRLALYREGHREWNWAMQSMDSRKRAELSDYAALRGLTHRQIFASQRSGLAVFTQVFPRVHLAEIEGAARTSGLPVEWIYGVIHQESRFMRFAQSSVGALGLMQVMPKTAQWVAQKIALKNYADGELMQLQTNLLIGSNYLKLVYDSVKGNAAMTTASYNAGPLKAQTWRASLPRTVEGAVFAETIPYGETRDYVMRVTTNIVQYSRYGTRPQKITDLLGFIEPTEVDKNMLP